ncbi:MAG: SIS domain-containing protein [Thermotogaceae bacterium]|nr:SIS domain-containing protein [Thermotogaceae bacterium]
MLGTILLCLNCPEHQKRAVLEKIISLASLKFDLIAWNKNTYKTFVDVPSFDEIVANNINFVLNTNKYETGINSSFIIKKEESTAITAIEGLPKTPLKELSEKLWQIFQSTGSENDFAKRLKDALSRETGAFSIVGYFKEREEEFLIAFSTYRDIFIDQNGESVFLTTISELAPEEVYMLPPNSLAFWSSQKRTFIGTKKKTRINQQFKHHMIREIYETPYVLKRIYSLKDYPSIQLATEVIENTERIWVAGSGSSLNAGLEFQYFLPELDIIAIPAFEFKLHKLSSLDKGDTVVAITQSGNTWGVLEVAKESKKRWANVISITNNPSLGKVTKYSDVIIPILAGHEAAIPATKSFTGTLGVLYLLSLTSKKKLGLINDDEMEKRLQNFSDFTNKLPDMLPQYEASAKTIAKYLSNLRGGYIISAGMTYPIAVEGALKLKEAAYSHAEPIELEEYLHGPSAALSEDMYNIVIQPCEEFAKKRFLQKFEKFHENLGHFVVVGATQEVQKKVKNTENISLVNIDYSDTILYPFHTALFIQLLSYWLGVYNNTPIDFPRGLVKMVEK